MVMAPVVDWEHLQGQLPAEQNKPKPVLTLYRDTNGWCPFCERLLLTLDTKQIPYEEVLIDLRNKPDWYKEMIPTALVPAIKVHSSGDIVYESVDIMKYLDEKFPETEALMQPQAEVAAALERNDALLSAGFRFAYANKSLSEAAKVEVKNNFTSALADLDKALSAGGPFLIGDRMTAADICLIPMMERYRYQLPLQAGMSVYDDTLPGIKRWFHAMDAEPVYSEQVAGDEVSWTLVTSTFLNFFARNAKDGIDPDTQKKIDTADAAARAVLEKAAAAAQSTELPAPAARHAAARKLIANHEAVVADASAGDTEPKSQISLKRLPSSASGVVDHVLRNAAARLLGLDPVPVSANNAALAAQAARYVATRVCAPRDMGAPAAAALRHVLFQEEASANALEEDEKTSVDWSQALAEAEEKVKKTIAAILDVSESKVTDGARFDEDLGVKLDEIHPDDMFNPTWLKLITACETALEVEVVPSRYFDMRTVKALVDYFVEAKKDKLEEKERPSPWYGEGEGPPIEML